MDWTLGVDYFHTILASHWIGCTNSSSFVLVCQSKKQPQWEIGRTKTCWKDSKKWDGLRQRGEIERVLKSQDWTSGPWRPSNTLSVPFPDQDGHSYWSKATCWTCEEPLIVDGIPWLRIQLSIKQHYQTLIVTYRLIHSSGLLPDLSINLAIPKLRIYYDCLEYRSSPSANRVFLRYIFGTGNTKFLLSG